MCAPPFIFLFCLPGGLPMKRRLKICYIIMLSSVLIIVGAFSSANRIAAQQRLERPPSRTLEGTPPIPGGKSSIPVGTILIIEMETPLSSKTAQASDIFKARIATPVVDEEGTTLIPAGSTIEGRVASAKPAKWPRRSGSISLTFEKLKLEGGKVLTVRGVLTSVSSDNSKKLDEERNLEPGSTTTRDAIIVGSGVGTGAVVGAAVGGALAGVGIGAAAGVTVMLLMPGKNAEIPQGQRFGFELLQPLNLGLSTPTPTTTRSKSSSTMPVRTSSGSSSGRSTSSGVVYPSSGGTSGSEAVDVSYVRAEYGPDGVVRILVIAETPTTGWRVFTNYSVSGDTVNVRLSGTRPASGATNQISHPLATPIKITDKNGAIRRALVRGKNGDREATVTASSGSRYIPPTGSTTTRPPSTSKPPTTTGSTSSPASSGSSSGSQVVNEIEQARYGFGSTIGVWINPDGTYDVIGQRQPTSDEKQLLDGLGSQLNSVKTYNNSSDPSSRRTNAAKVSEDTNLVEQTWKRVKMSSDLNGKFKTMIQDTRALVANDLSGSAPPPTSTTTPPPSSSTPSSGGSGSSLSQESTRVAGEVTQVQYSYGATIGVWINPDGTYDVLGTRKPTADEKQILDGLTNLLKSVKAVGNSSSPSAQRSAASQIKSAATSIEQAQKKVTMSDDLNKQFTTMIQDSRALAEMAAR